MARKEQKTWVITDDLTGEELSVEEVQTIKFAYGQTEYEIDLSPKNYDEFDKFISKYIGAARRVGNKGLRTRGKASGKELGPVRSWAAANGYQISSRGRVPKAVLDAYEKAQ